MYRNLLMLVLICGAGLLNAAEAPLSQPDVATEGMLSTAEAPDEAMMAAEAAYQLTQRDERGNLLDTTVFTAISPMTVPDVAIRLPADQEE